MCDVVVRLVVRLAHPQLDKPVSKPIGFHAHPHLDMGRTVMVDKDMVIVSYGSLGGKWRWGLRARGGGMHEGAVHCMHPPLPRQHSLPPAHTPRGLTSCHMPHAPAPPPPSPWQQGSAGSGCRCGSVRVSARLHV